MGVFMIRINEICEALKNVCGWEQSYDPAKAIDDKLTQTESGLYFQGAHPLMTIENMQSILPDDWGFQYPEWNVITEYKAGQKVQCKGTYWIAKIDNTGNEPRYSDFNGDYNEDFGCPYWKPYNILSDFLERITRNGIATVVQTFTQMKQLTRETRNLLERRTFFDGAGRIRSVIQNSMRLVGYEIVPVRAMGVTTKIERVGLQMIGGTGNVRLYLFHSSQIDPVKVFDLNFTATNGGFQWFELKDCFLPYISDGNNAGGSWFLCYNQDDLPTGVEAINMSKDWSKEPCSSCSGYVNLQAWRELTKYLQISPFAYNVSGDFKENPQMWDIEDTIYTNTINYGLNVEVTVGCDLTDFIISQRQLFQTVIQRQVAAIALRTLAMNPNVRVNRNQSNASRMDILYELDGNTASTRPSGLGYALKEAYKALRLDTQGLDRICLTCNNHGVKYTTV